MSVATAPAEAGHEAAAAEHTDHDEGRARPGGLAGLLGTGDHVAVGRLFVLASLLFVLVVVVAAGLSAFEAVDADDALFSGLVNGQLASLHAYGAVVLFLVPAFLGVAIAVVPLQLGAATVAFPRAVAASFWGWFLSGGVLIASYFVEGGPLLEGEQNGRLLWLVGFGGTLVALTLASICVVTSLWALRTAGMGLDRTPAFSWSMLIAGTTWSLTFPAIAGLTVLSYLQNRYDGAAGDAGLGLNRLALTIGLPAMFAWALPALGVLFDAAATAFRSRVRFHGVLIGAIAVFGVLAYSADLGVAFQRPDSPVFQDFLYVVASFALVLPLLALAGGVADLARSGKPKLTAPLVLGVLSFLLLLLGAAANAVRVVDNLDLTGTSADAGVAHIAWVAGALGVVAALHHWSTKLFGVVAKDGIGILAGLALAGGGVVTGGAWFAAGFADLDADTAEVLTGPVALVGWALVLGGVLLVLVNLAGASAAARKGDPAPADPWDGLTLEWLTASPPVPGGVGPLEPVTSPTPLLDQKEAAK